MNRMRELDGVRGLAVGLVVLHHWTPIGHQVGLGNIGVQLFFVLSGFLITGILLDLRRAHDDGRITRRALLARFWESRAARILPVVMVTLVAVYLAGDRFEKRHDMLWHFGFASNVLFFQRGAFDSSLSHFWTLAVEQQFYLLWPVLVLTIARARLEAAILALVALAPLSRLALHAAGYQAFAQFNVLPFANFDSLGMGALMAVWARLPREAAAPRRRLLSWVGLASVAAIIVNRAAVQAPANLEQTLFALVFAWIVALAAEGLPGIAGRAMGSRFMVALGMVSYGVYVYHVFAPRAVGAAMRAADVPLEYQGGIALFVASAVVTGAAAAVSWFAMEHPINRARRNRQRRATLDPSLRPA
jgi:peptidoglycan/LPS O-acetylase OafA/YrhL